jgi:hypothetical protein
LKGHAAAASSPEYAPCVTLDLARNGLLRRSMLGIEIIEKAE